MERRAPALGTLRAFLLSLAVPAAIFELLAQELIGQCVIRFFEIRADAENSAVDTWLRFTMQERPVLVPLKNEPFNAAHHFARLFALRVETEVLQDDERVKRNEQGRILFWPAPLAGGRLAGEKFGSPAFGCDS
jgi:hypothetical protein